MEIVIKKGGTLWWKKFHFVIKANNDKILCRSRKFNTVDETLNWLDKIKRSLASGLGLELEITKTESDQPYHFRMVNIYEDSEILLWSENYHNKKDCMDAMNLVKRNINNANIVTP